MCKISKKEEKKMTTLDKQIDDLIFKLSKYKERAEIGWKKVSWNIDYENFYKKYYLYFDGFLQKLYPLRGLDEKTYFKEKSFLSIEEESKEKMVEFDKTERIICGKR